jgi:hypothetical protein
MLAFAGRWYWPSWPDRFTRGKILPYPSYSKSSGLQYWSEPSGEDTLFLLPNKAWFHGDRKHEVTSSPSSRSLFYDKSIACSRVLLAAGASAFAFNFQHHLIFSRSFSSCLRLLPRHSVAFANKIHFRFRFNDNNQLRCRPYAICHMPYAIPFHHNNIDRHM